MCNLVDFVRLDIGKIKLSPETADIQTFTNQAAARWRNKKSKLPGDFRNLGDFGSLLIQNNHERRTPVIDMLLEGLGEDVLAGAVAAGAEVMVRGLGGPTHRKMGKFNSNALLHDVVE